MEDTERDQQIRVEVRVHMGVQVGAELVLAADIGLDERLFDVKAVVLRLAHERFGDRGDVRLALDRAVGKDVGYLGVGKPQDVDLAVAFVDVARHFSADDLQTVVTPAQRQTADPSEVRDQVALRVVRRAHKIAHTAVGQLQLNDDILFLVEIEFAEIRHNMSSVETFHLL